MAVTSSESLRGIFWASACWAAGPQPGPVDADRVSRKCLSLRIKVKSVTKLLECPSDLAAE